jgi:hypothetical protein
MFPGRKANTLGIDPYMIYLSMPVLEPEVDVTSSYLDGQDRPRGWHSKQIRSGPGNPIR